MPVSPVSLFIDRSALVGSLGVVVGVFGCCGFAFSCFTDQSVRSSYQPMTILA